MMPFSHSDVYIVQVSDELADGPTAWYVGPYGSTRADNVADELERAVRASDRVRSRTCTVEPLFSNDECLTVSDY